MAEIFHAFDAHDHEVAIKKIHPDLASQEKFIQMFLDEVRIVIQLNHPNIVQLLDFGLAEGSYFFSMEWIDGKSLSEIISAQKKLKVPFPIDVAMWLIRDVCRGLHYAHHKKDRFHKPMNLVHRDISPPNIMATRDGVFKVADFGIAHVRDKNVRTQPGIIRGKFSYMSPEQSLGKPLDQRSDIFSTGIILYEILADTRLFLRKNEIETLEAVRKCLIPPIKSKRLDTPPAVEEMIRRTLSVNPASRYATAHEFADAATKVIQRDYPESTRARVVEFFKTLFPDEKFKSADMSRDASMNLGRAKPVSVAQPPSSSFDMRAWVLAHRYSVSALFALACLLVIEWIV